MFQSSADLEAIGTNVSDLTRRKIVQGVRPNILDHQRNRIVHALGEDDEKTFLDDISLGHLLTKFEEENEDVSLEFIIPQSSYGP